MVYITRAEVIVLYMRMKRSCETIDEQLTKPTKKPCVDTGGDLKVGDEIELLSDDDKTWLPSIVTRMHLKQTHGLDGTEYPVMTLIHEDGVTGSYCLVNADKLYDIARRDFVQWRPCSEMIGIEYEGSKSLVECVETIINEMFVNVLSTTKDQFDALPFELQIELGRNVFEAREKLVKKAVQLFEDNKSSETTSDVSKDELVRVITDALAELV